MTSLYLIVTLATSLTCPPSNFVFTNVVGSVTNDGARGCSCAPDLGVSFTLSRTKAEAALKAGSLGARAWEIHYGKWLDFGKESTRWGAMELKLKAETTYAIDHENVEVAP